MEKTKFIWMDGEVLDPVHHRREGLEIFGEEFTSDPVVLPGRADELHREVGREVVQNTDYLRLGATLL